MSCVCLKEFNTSFYGTCTFVCICTFWTTWFGSFALDPTIDWKIHMSSDIRDHWNIRVINLHMHVALFEEFHYKISSVQPDTCDLSWFSGSICDYLTSSLCQLESNGGKGLICWLVLIQSKLLLSCQQASAVLAWAARSGQLDLSRLLHDDCMILQPTPLLWNMSLIFYYLYSDLRFCEPT